MRYLTGLLSLIFLFGVLAYAQETSTDDATMGLPGKGIPVRSALSPNVSVPNKISYQGLLTTTGGAPVVDGAYELKFELFNVSGGGGALWTETQPGVNVYKGTFSVLLGSVAPLTGIFYQPLWVEVTANSGPGIAAPILFTPRTELASAAYSLGPWYSEAESIYVRDSKNVGINTTGPLFALDVHQVSTPTVAKFGSNDAIYLIKSNPHVGFNIYFDGGFRYGSTNQGGATIAYDQDVNNSFSFNTAPNGSADEIATLSTRMTIREDGKVGIGTVAPDKLLEVAGSARVTDTLFIGPDSPVVKANNYSVFGGEITLHDELGNAIVDFRPNGWGEGGGLNAYRGPGEMGVQAWGNWWGTGEGYLGVFGDYRSMEFEPRFAGDPSVQLPDSSISALEMLNEPGIAAEFGSLLWNLANVTSNQRVDSITINVPAAGKVIVEANGYVLVTHTNGTNDNIGLHVMTDPAGDVYQNGCSRVFVNATLPTATDYTYNFGCRNIFNVASSTSLKIYLIVRQFSGATISSTYVARSAIFATYYPTTYGNTPVVLSSMPQQGVVEGSAEDNSTINVIYQSPEEHLNQLKAKAAQLKEEIEATMKQLDKSADGSKNGGN